MRDAPTTQQVGALFGLIVSPTLIVDGASQRGGAARDR